MRVLLDHNIPVQLVPRLPEDQVSTARQMGWDRLKNGDLLLAAQNRDFQVMITGDQNIIYQQNNSKRRIALVLLTEIKRRLILSDVDLIREAIKRSVPGGFEVVTIRRILEPIPLE